MIFDIVEYIIMEWTMPNERNVLLHSKTKQERLRGRQVLGTSGCCKRVNTVEKTINTVAFTRPI